MTVACGIVSGFHSTQSTLISRTVENEKDGRQVFYNMMIAEGFIAMIWAAASMGVMNLGLANADTPATEVVGIVAKSLLGNVGGLIAVIGVILLPITSGDTALRSLRVIITESFHIKADSKHKKLIISLCIFGAAGALLIFAKSNQQGFGYLWNYFSWANQTVAVFTFSVAAIYMMKNQKPFIMALIPGMFYMYIVTYFILNEKIGFGININICYIISSILTLLYGFSILYFGKSKRKNICSE